ncbi:MAG: hypothetical protein ABFS38_15920, partial [Bacteroidota bacterium]
MKKQLPLIAILIVLSISILTGSCSLPDTEPGWRVSVLPSSVRLDPSTNEIIERRFDAVNRKNSGEENLLVKNWIFDGKQVTLHAARGEYISFQVVLTKQTESSLKGINIDIAPFKSADTQLKINPELFLEWAVEVKTPSTGYPKASLGKGWYPDALIPLKYIQADSAKVKRRWTYPLELPDFNNRIDNQRSLIIWV